LKILIVGKVASVTHWLEDCAAAWRAEGHEVRIAAARNPGVHSSIEALLLSERLGAPLAAGIARQARRRAPDLMVAIGAYHIPTVVLERLAALPGRCPILGWVGDLFSPGAARAAELLDAVAYTDSGLLALHAELGFAASAAWLPHAVNPHAAAGGAPLGPRRPRLAFVANPTKHRRDVVGQIDWPISLYGPGWTAAPGARHHLHARRVRPGAVPAIYAGHLAALNIRNELNVLAGLNQRNFDPCLSGTPVLSDAQGDLERCFEPGREVLVWRDARELNEAYEALRADPERAAAIGAAGRRRVLAEHTYARRLESLAAMAGGFEGSSKRRPRAL
jgi:spore maturation protein CgeB